MSIGIVKKVVSILSYVCYVLIFVYAVISIPSVFGYKPLVVLSGSMEPTYKVGDVIFYKNISEDKLKTNDVITFVLKNEYITHRIENIKDGYYITKGDANEDVDPTAITYDNIKGKVGKISIPYIGYYIKFVNTNLYLVVIVILILLLEFVLSNFVKKKEKVIK